MFFVLFCHFIIFNQFFFLWKILYFMVNDLSILEPTTEIELKKLDKNEENHQQWPNVI